MNGRGCWNCYKHKQSSTFNSRRQGGTTNISYRKSLRQSKLPQCATCQTRLTRASVVQPWHKLPVKKEHRLARIILLGPKTHWRQDSYNIKTERSKD